eukprot:gene5320-4250_t
MDAEAPSPAAELMDTLLAQLSPATKTLVHEQGCRWATECGSEVLAVFSAESSVVYYHTTAESTEQGTASAILQATTRSISMQNADSSVTVVPLPTHLGRYNAACSRLAALAGQFGIHYDNAPQLMRRQSERSSTQAPMQAPMQVRCALSAAGRDEEPRRTRRLLTEDITILQTSSGQCELAVSGATARATAVGWRDSAQTDSVCVMLHASARSLSRRCARWAAVAAALSLLLRLARMAADAPPLPRLQALAELGCGGRGLEALQAASSDANTKLMVLHGTNQVVACHAVARGIQAYVHAETGTRRSLTRRGVAVACALWCSECDVHQWQVSAGRAPIMLEFTADIGGFGDRPWPAGRRTRVPQPAHRRHGDYVEDMQTNYQDALYELATRTVQEIRVGDNTDACDCTYEEPAPPPVPVPKRQRLVPVKEEELVPVKAEPGTPRAAEAAQAAQFHSNQRRYDNEALALPGAAGTAAFQWLPGYVNALFTCRRTGQSGAHVMIAETALLDARLQYGVAFHGGWRAREPVMVVLGGQDPDPMWMGPHRIERPMVAALYRRQSAQQLRVPEVARECAVRTVRHFLEQPTHQTIPNPRSPLTQTPFNPRRVVAEALQNWLQ